MQNQVKIQSKRKLNNEPCTSRYSLHIFKNLPASILQCLAVLQLTCPKQTNENLHFVLP